MRTEHWRAGDAERSPHGLRRTLLLAGLAALLIGAAVFGFLRSNDANAERRVADDEVAQIDLLRARVELAWLHHDLLTDSLADQLAARPAEPTFAEFGAERSRLLDEIRGFTRSGGDVAPLADALLDVHDDIAVGRWPVASSDLDILHYESMPFEPVAGPVAQRLDGYLDGVEASMVPRLVLGDALAIAMQRDEQPPPRWAADYVEQTASLATDNPGWFGPARQSPMTNHVLSAPSASGAVYRNVPTMADAVDSVEPQLGLAWDYDQWIIAGDFDTEPPLTIDELVTEVAEISAAFEAGFLAGIADERAAVIDAAPGESAATLWLMAAIVSLVLLVIGLAVATVRQMRQQRVLTQAAYVDGLTGAFNRRFLNEEVEGWCHRHGGYIAVAMVDLDRFKLVNDTWGHAAGDAILTEASSRLALAAAGIGQDDHDATSAVIRIGGDEFLLAWVGGQPFDVDAIERAISDVAGPVDTDEGDSVPLELSVGVSSSPTPTQLDDLMRAADLAAYAHKGTKRPPEPQPSPELPSLSERG